MLRRAIWKDLVTGLADCLLDGPLGEQLGRRIERDDRSLRIRHVDRVARVAEDDVEAMLFHLKVRVELGVSRRGRGKLFYFSLETVKKPRVVDRYRRLSAK